MIINDENAAKAPDWIKPQETKPDTVPPKSKRASNESADRRVTIESTVPDHRRRDKPMVIAACPSCGSNSPRTIFVETGACANIKGCIERKCRRREIEDRKRFEHSQWFEHSQCPSTYSRPRSRTIYYCELRTEHEGLHLNGTKEWSDGAWSNKEKSSSV